MLRSVFGLFDRLSGAKRKAAQAHRRELAGDLDRAVELYLEAEKPDEAARVLLLKGDAEPEPQQRLLIYAQAARVGGETDGGREASRRKARLGFDIVRAGAAMASDLSRVAAELEGVGEWQSAAEAYALAGDTEAEIRVLKEAGAIDQLEDRLAATSASAREERARTELIRRMRDLDAIAERRPAVAAAHGWLERHPHDEQVRLEAERITNRLAVGPEVELLIDGVRQNVIFGGELTLGRAGADIEIHAGSISRRHLRFFRDDTGEPTLEDLGTRNGTTLAGARLSGPVPIGRGIRLRLAGRIEVRVEPVTAGGPIRIEAAGSSLIAPLGPLVLGDWSLEEETEARYLTLRTRAGGTPPYRGDYRLADVIELCLGDRFSRARGEEPVLEVPDDRSGGSWRGSAP